MKYYAGLDVSLKEISICIVDDDGKIVAQGSAPCPALTIPLLQKPSAFPGGLPIGRSNFPFPMCLFLKVWLL